METEQLIDTLLKAISEGEENLSEEESSTSMVMKHRLYAFGHNRMWAQHVINEYEESPNFMTVFHVVRNIYFLIEVIAYYQRKHWFHTTYPCQMLGHTVTTIFSRTRQCGWKDRNIVSKQYRYLVRECSMAKTDMGHLMRDDELNTIKTQAKNEITKLLNDKTNGAILTMSKQLHSSKRRVIVAARARSTTLSWGELYEPVFHVAGHPHTAFCSIEMRQHSSFAKPCLRMPCDMKNLWP